jgi:hypothetical protein
VSVGFRSDDGAEEAEVHFAVRTENVAGTASRILHNADSPNLERISDGQLKDPAFYSETQSEPFEQWYGFEWEAPQQISRLGYHVGYPREEWGWLKHIRVEYRAEDDTWTEAGELAIMPPLPAGDSKYLQPGLVGYDLRFNSVSTRAVRIVGMAGGHPVDSPPIFGSAVSELTAHER